MSQTTSISRDSLIQLGRSGQPWQFLATMRHIGSAADADPAIVFVHAANLAKLGLKELAASRLAILPPQVLALPDVDTLTRAIHALAPALIPPAHLESTFAANARALISRGISDSEVSRYKQLLLAQLSTTDIYRAIDRNIYIPGLLEDDAKARSRDLITNEKDAGEYPAALVIESLLPPWLVTDAAARWTRNQMGFWRRLILIHENPATLALGLSLADISSELSQSRTWLFLGEGAVPRLSEYLRLHRDEMLISRLISLRDAQSISAELATAIVSRSSEQSAELKDLKETVDLRYASRDKAFWARRYREATADHSRAAPLRVLVPTTRYSTVLQHSSRDIVEAFKSIGHDARLLIEPDDSCTMAANAYWRAYADFDPDLVILANYPRPLRTSTTPANIPYVTWLQDAMPHLFDSALPAQFTDLDFSCGYLFNHCFLHGNWDCAQAISSPIVVNPRKFHSAPVTGFDHLSCDVAFVSNHSEGPEKLHSRLQSMLLSGGVPRPCIDELQSLALEAVENVHARGMWTFIPARFDALMARFAVATEASAKLMHSYLIPMAGELFRHQSLLWTREICTRRGWKLNLYGKGWDANPAFASCARGPIAHGEELRAAYQKAKVHLHLDLNTLMHQRVSECFLSGGFIISRFFADSLDSQAILAERAMMSTSCEATWHDGRPAWITSKHEPLRAHNQMRASIGVPPRFDSDFWPKPPDPLNRFTSLPLFPGTDPVHMLGDLKQLTFTTPRELEHLLAHAIADPAFRAATSAAILPKVHDLLTHDAMCRRILSLITHRLAASPS